MPRYHLTIFLELGLSAMTALWVRKEREERKVPNGSASWIASGLRIIEEQYVSLCTHPFNK